MTGNSSLMSLGRDILLYLLSQMDLDSIFELRSTSRAIRDMVDNEINWSRLYLAEFSDVNLPSQIGFLDFYARCKAKCITSLSLQIEALELQAGPLSCTDLNRDILKLQLSRFPDAKWLQTSWCTKSVPETAQYQAEQLKAQLASNAESIEARIIALASIKTQTSSLLLNQNGRLYRKYLSTKSVAASSIQLKRIECNELIKDIQQVKNIFYAITLSGKLIFWTRSQEVESTKSPTILLPDAQVLQENCQSLVVGRENCLTGATNTIIITTTNELLHMRISGQGTATIKPLITGSLKSIIPHGKSTFVVQADDDKLSLLDVCTASLKPLPLCDVVSLACSARACAALTKDGKVYTWGFEQDRKTPKGVWAQNKTMSSQIPSILTPEPLKLPGHAVDLESNELELVITTV